MTMRTSHKTVACLIALLAYVYKHMKPKVLLKYAESSANDPSKVTNADDLHPLRSLA
jgi:hypothetical protein